MKNKQLDYNNLNFLRAGMKKALRVAMATFADDEAWAGRSGFYACVADGGTGEILMLYSFGTIPEEKFWKYLSFCQEKAKRLAAHPEHLSSWQSRNPDNSQYGGAIRVGRFILSCSGLPELGDEAVMLLVANMGFLVLRPENLEAVIQGIIQASQNPYYAQLSRACI